MMMRCRSRLIFRWKGEEIIELELNIDESVDAALGMIHAQGFDPIVDVHSVHVDDVAPPIVKLSDAKHHVSLLSNFLLDNSLHFGVNEIVSFQKLVGNLDKKTVATWVGNTKNISTLISRVLEKNCIFLVL
jgi:hypothetical protein